MELKLDLTFTCGAIEGELLVLSASISEGISQPTRATVDLLSVDEIDGEPALGEPATVAILVDGSPVRHFQLVLTSFTFEGIHGGNRHRYRAELSHELSLLALRSDVRWFQEKDAQVIVSEVLDGAGLDAGHFTWSLLRTPGKRTYCVQYRESDFAFISRLLEHEGVFYFAHDDDASTHVTLGDGNDVFPPIEGDTEVRLTDDDQHALGIHELTLEHRVTASGAAVGDYNYDTPAVELNFAHDAPGGAVGERYEYAAGHQTEAEGKTFAKLRCEEQQAKRTVGRGKSDRYAFRAGSWFELAEAVREGASAKYVLRTVDHHVVVREVSGREAKASYANRFTCFPHETPFRPPRTTPRPRQRGYHSVVVTGPSGSEIHTDKLGRMKGKFFWDRVGKDDDTSSLWMRVVQLPIGGSMALARMTWEMGLVYFDGDPDRPVAVSRLYNAEKTSPYGYPAAKTRMALQTPSSPGGGKSNELRMEDGGGGMEMFINASKNFDAQVNNNKTEKVGVDETVQVGVDCSWTIGANQTVSVGANDTTSISGDATVVVTKDRKKTVGASETVTVTGKVESTITGSDSETTGGSHTTLATMSINRTAQGSHSLTVGGSMISAAGLGVSVMCLGARSETVGGAKIVASGGGVSETVLGALAVTVGGVCVQAAGGNRTGGTKGASAVTVGGLLTANAAGKVSLTAKKINILVAGVANFLGGGGILNLTPGSAALVGLVTLDASGSIKISGNPNLVG